MNVVKLFVLVALPVALFITAGFFGAGEEVLFFGFLLLLVISVGMYWFSDRIVLKMCGAELLTVYHSPTIFRAVEEMCRQADLPAPTIYMIAEAAPNICSVGRNRRNAGLVFTDGILKSLSADELRCAIAHELVHIYRRDTLLATLAATFASLLGMSTKAARETASADDVSTSADGRLLRFAFNGMLTPFAPIAATLIQWLIDVKREFRADEHGAKLTGNPLAMANTIRTMEKKKHVTPMDVVPAVAHLFMVSPLRPGRIERMFSTHPSMVRRIERLEAMHRSMPQTKHVSVTK
ncbi:MAG: M48 family metalloprotease [Bacteroidota bacterium]